MQPGPNAASRLPIALAPGDLLAHSFDMQHGVEVASPTTPATQPVCSPCAARLQPCASRLQPRAPRLHACVSLGCTPVCTRLQTVCAQAAPLCVQAAPLCTQARGKQQRVSVIMWLTDSVPSCFD